MSDRGVAPRPRPIVTSPKQVEGSVPSPKGVLINIFVAGLAIGLRGGKTSGDAPSLSTDYRAPKDSGAPQDSKLFAPKDDEKRLTAIAESSSVCETCVGWISTNLPGVIAKSLIEEMARDEALAEDIVSAAAGNGMYSGGASAPQLLGEMVGRIGHEMSMKVAALSFHDISREYGKTPKALNLKPYQVPNKPFPLVFYCVRMHAAWKYKYPTLKIFSSFSSGAVETHAVEGKKSFQSQPQMLLNGLSSATTGTEPPHKKANQPKAACEEVVSMLQAFPSHEDLVKRSQSIAEKATARSRRNGGGRQRLRFSSAASGRRASRTTKVTGTSRPTPPPTRRRRRSWTMSRRRRIPTLEAATLCRSILVRPVVSGQAVRSGSMTTRTRWRRRPRSRSARARPRIWWPTSPRTRTLAAQCSIVSGS